MHVLNHWLKADHAMKTTAQHQYVAFTSMDAMQLMLSSALSTKLNAKHGKFIFRYHFHFFCKIGVNQIQLDTM